MAGAYDDRFDDRVGVLGEDSHLEMAYEDSVAHPLVNDRDYNEGVVDLSFTEAQEYAFEASLEELDEEDE